MYHVRGMLVLTELRDGINWKVPAESFRCIFKTVFTCFHFIDKGIMVVRLIMR